MSVSWVRREMHRELDGKQQGSGGGMFRGRHRDGDERGSRVWLCVKARHTESPLVVKGITAFPIIVWPL